MRNSPIYLCRPVDKPDSVFVVSLRRVPESEHLVARALPLIMDTIPQADLLRLKTVEFVDIEEMVKTSIGQPIAGAHYTFTDKELQNFILKASSEENKAKQDELWSMNPARNAVFTAVLPFMSHNEPYVPAERVTHRMSVPSALSNYIRVSISEKVGIPKDDIYVAPQIVAGHDVKRAWEDFQCAARDRLVDNVKYVKHTYDEQAHEAGKLLVPLYGIFISIKKEFPRVVSWKDYIHFINCVRREDMFERPALVDHFRGISNDAGFASAQLQGFDTYAKIYADIGKLTSRLAENDMQGSGLTPDEAKEGGALSFLKKLLPRRK